ITRSAGSNGLARLGSPPIAARASRMAARSTTQGTPVKSCSRTRAGMKLISLTPAPAPPATAAPKLFFAIGLIIEPACFPCRTLGLKFPGQSADLSNVAIYAAAKEQSFDDIRILLANLVRSFEADPSTNRNRIRDVLDNDRERFYGTSIEILKTSGDCRGAHYLVALFVSSGLLLRALCDPALSREDALSLGRAAKRVDPLADVVLARHLADSAMGSGPVQIADPARLMDILCEIADP